MRVRAAPDLPSPKPPRAIETGESWIVAFDLADDSLWGWGGAAVWSTSASSGWTTMMREWLAVPNEERRRCWRRRLPHRRPLAAAREPWAAWAKRRSSVRRSPMRSRTGRIPHQSAPIGGSDLLEISAPAGDLRRRPPCRWRAAAMLIRRDYRRRLGRLPTIEASTAWFVAARTSPLPAR